MRFMIAFACCLAASSAAASGGLSCHAEDGHVEIAINSGITRGMGSALFAFGADVEVKDQRVRPELRQMHFERDHVPQYWLEGGALMLRLYRETEGNEPHAFVQMLVRTQLDDNHEELRGDYAIQVYDTETVSHDQAHVVELAGAITCFVE